MKNKIMIASSCPTIITKGGNPRVNKEEINNIFLRKYIQILGELLKIKGKINNLNIIYIGGYTKEENTSRAKLYISAYNYYLNNLGYELLNKTNLTILDTKNIEENLEKIEQCDLLLLGIGCDKTFNSIIEALENKGINLNKLIDEKNIVISSICSGSVMTANQIYGGMYDSFYYGRETYEYPKNIKTLNFNPVTMETSFYPQSQTEEKTKEYIEKYLKPDSERISFFACKPNSLFLISENKIYSYGETYLFIDGTCLELGKESEKVEVTNLVKLVNDYNTLKNRQNIIDKEKFTIIKKEIEELRKNIIETNLDNEEKAIIEEFSKNEKKQKEKREKELTKWKKQIIEEYTNLINEENLTYINNNETLKRTLEKLKNNYININSNLTTDYIRELYIKLNIISILKKAYTKYQGYYTDFKKDLYEFLYENIKTNETLVYYIIETCGSLFTNRELKQILKQMKIEIEKRPQQIIETTIEQLKYFRKELKYERS